MSTFALAETPLAVIHRLAMAVALGHIVVFDVHVLRRLHQPPTAARRGGTARRLADAVRAAGTATLRPGPKRR